MAVIAGTECGSVLQVAGAPKAKSTEKPALYEKSKKGSKKRQLPGNGKSNGAKKLKKKSD